MRLIKLNYLSSSYDPAHERVILYPIHDSGEYFTNQVAGWHIGSIESLNQAIANSEPKSFLVWFQDHFNFISVLLSRDFLPRTRKPDHRFSVISDRL